MKILNRWAIRAAVWAAFFITCVPTFAQYVPNYAVPIGKGAGQTGYRSVGPCAVGSVIAGSGASADPYCLTGAINVQSALSNWWFGQSGNLTGTGVNNTGTGKNALNANTTGTAVSAFGAGAAQKNTTGVSNSTFGYAAAFENVSGSYNNSFGVNANASNVSGGYNNAFGVEAFYHSTASFNAGFGNAVGFNNGTGTRLAYFGAGVGYGDPADTIRSTADYASGFGADALNHNQSASYATALGYGSQFTNVSSPSNTTCGAESAYNLASGTGGNTACGRGSMYTATTAFQNALFGMNSGYAMLGASNNSGTGYSVLSGCTSCTGIVAEGYYAAQTLTTATNSTILGQQVGSTTYASGTNVILIGTDARTDTPLAATSDYMNLSNVIYATGITGTVGAPAGKVGVKMTPVNDFDVSGTIGATGQLISTVATGTAPLAVSSTTQVSNFNASLLGGKTFADPGPIGSGTPAVGNFTTLSAAATTITSASSGALSVGRLGATTAAFQVDASAATSVTGIKVTAAATGGGAGIAAQGDTNTNLRIDASGSGTITMGGTSTGAITLTRATTMSGALTYGGVTLSNAVTGTGNMVLSASPTLSGTVGGALTFSGALTLSSALTYGGVTLSNAVTGTGNMVLSAAPTFTGTASFATISASASVSAGTFLDAAAGSGYKLSGNTAFYGDATYTYMKDGAGASNALQLGNTGDPTNYYVNTTHNFQTRAGGAMAQLTTSGFNSVAGYSANGAAGVSTTCTVTAGNSYVFTFGLLTTKGANCT